MGKAIVVGGGVIGLACAWELARRDVEVTVVDAGKLGGGASSGNAGWICPSLVPSLEDETIELFDVYAAEGVEFELYRQGLVVAARTAAALEPYRRPGRLKEVDASIEPALDASCVVLHAETDCHVRPETLIAGLVRSLASMGVTLLENRAVSALVRRGKEWVAGDLVAPNVVVAAGLDSERLLRAHGVRIPLVGARGYSVEAIGTGELPRHAVYLVETRLALSPFGDSVRIAGLLEFGGRPRRPDLLAAARPYLGGWNPVTASEPWSALRPMTPDGIPRVGPVADGLYVATGHGMFGVTLAPATASRLARSWTG